MILRGKDIQHHNIVNDMMIVNEITYRPQPGADKVSQDSNIVAVVTMGFVKDARAHIDVQGYNVYHKNRLIKPFWRLWNVAGSDGRGVIGVLEANFVEPAHDKQGFERTIVLSRLEARLIQMQKNYWYAL
ncbi:putative morc, S5 domain 2 protein [Helianthus annuus]|nr:putative morc, S5 domain 2 protein [Helianthus annuus]KAJ0748074.1 putative morc, S5 domain 2 protein [Helianthus annuus]